jgi:hypothetical protein
MIINLINIGIVSIHKFLWGELRRTKYWLIKVTNLSKKGYSVLIDINSRVIVMAISEMT